MAFDNPPRQIDYLAVRGAALARLTDDAALMARLKIAPQAGLTLADVETQGQPTPSVHMIFEQFEVADAQRVPNAVAYLQRQFWLFAVRVINSRDSRSNQHAEDTAGPILGRLDELLIGWAPLYGFSPFRAETPPLAERVPGYSLIPLRFSTTARIIRDHTAGAE